MKKMNQINRIITKYQEAANFCGMVSEQQIFAAEQRLEVCFPEDYRSFLMQYGAGSFGGIEIYGIVPELERKAVPNGIWLTEDLREKDDMPKNYVAIAFDGFGNYYCIETKKKQIEEATVVLFTCNPEELTENEGRASVVADSFEGFLLTAMKSEIDFMI